MIQHYQPKMFTILILLLCSFTLAAQIEVTDGNSGIFTPESLITNVFLGDGVDVSSITFEGNDGAVGYFTNAIDDIGIERGIVMSTGMASTAAMANNAGNTTGNTSGGTVTDADLSAIANAGIQDVAKYEITFTPTSDTLRFKYVFASEEYPEWACTQYNDVFGFFITGPNPDGGAYNSENIALIPDLSDPTGLTFTNIPVTINNVNGNGVNTGGGCAYDYDAYYNSNDNSQSFSFDAYTSVFIAQVVVEPCQTYTIKLGVADRGDALFDTAVFLEAKSFGTGTLNVETATVSLDGTLTEGCSDAEISFVLPTAVEADYPLDYNIIGTADNGVDYTLIPDDLFIPAGDSILTIPLEAFEDGITEGTESIGFDIQRDVCNRDTFWVFIRDNDILPPELGPDLVLCLGDSTQLDGTLPVELPPPPTFSSTEEISLSTHNVEYHSEIQVFGVQPFLLAEGVIKRICLDSIYHNWDDDLDIFLVTPGGQFIELSTDNGVDGNNYLGCCFTPDATVPINDPGPFAPASSAPFTGNWLPEGVWSDLWDGENPTNGFWDLIIKDDSQGFSGTLKGWTICFEPVRQFNYSWFPTTGLSCSDCPDPMATPEVTTQYELTATDNYGCEVYDTIVIEVFDAIPPPPITCQEPTGSTVGIDWEPITGISEYEVNVNGAGWATNNTLTAAAGGLSLGECVTFEVRGVGLCEGTIQTLECCTPVCALNDVDVQSVNNECFGDLNGSITVTAITDNPPLSYEMDLGGTIIETNATGQFSNLASGNYIINVSDALNCSSVLPISITEPEEISSSSLLINDVNCFDAADGSATVEVNGGAYPYIYNWSDSQTDSIATGLAAGDYLVTISDANNCSTTDAISIVEPPVLEILLETDSVTCAGESSGGAILTITGGTADYTYEWSNGDTNDFIGDVTVGIYSVTATDANNCTIEETIEVFEPEYLSSTIEFSNAGCFEGADGNATAMVTGGQGPYTYNWSNGTSEQQAIDLAAGDYTVIITDANDCIIQNTVTIGESDPMTLSLDATTASCFNSTDGTAMATAGGGTGTYTYLWDDPAGQQTATATNLVAGDYTVTVTDENNCLLVETITVDQATQIDLVAATTDLSCNGIANGLIDITPDGGTAPYTYNWNNGAVTEDLNDIPAGDYNLTITDANGCSAILNQNITEPFLMEVTLQANPVDCNGSNTGSISTVTVGGTGNYSYAWTDGQSTESAIDLLAGNYAVIVTDENGCTAESTIIEVTEPEGMSSNMLFIDALCFGSADGIAEVEVVGGNSPYTYAWNNSAQTTASVNDVASGEHTVIITDASGCTHTNSVMVGEAAEILIDVQHVDVSCFDGFDGTATATVSGGNGGFSYSWTNGPYVSFSQTAENMEAGTYTLEVTDANNCSASTMVTLDQATEISNSFTLENVNCFGGSDGSALAEPSGGTGPYTYEWNNGGTSALASDLSPDIYTVTITDANNCTSTDFIEVLVPFAMNSTADLTNVDCYDSATGAIDINMEGGVPPYNYIWNNGSATEDIDQLIAGNYQVTVSDANNCTYEFNIDVDQPEEPVTLSLTTPDIICNDAANGSSTVTVTGGTAPYTYLWDTGETNATAFGLNAGTHEVTVTDSEDCSFIGTIEQTQYAPINVELSKVDPLCHDGTGATATIESIAYGNDNTPLADFSFIWSGGNGQSTSNINNLTAGQSYTVTVSNAIGCTGTAVIDISNPDEMYVRIDSTENISCYDGNDGMIAVSGLGGTEPYNYTWSDNVLNSNGAIANGAIASDLIVDNYQVTITDDNNCTAINNIQLEQPTRIQLDIRQQAVSCNGDNDGSIEALANGGVEPYQYAWSNGDITVMSENLSAGDYELILTDDNGCTKVLETYLPQPPAIVNQHDVRDITCFDGQDGMITLTTGGGKSPFEYQVNGGEFNASNVIIGLKEGLYDVDIRDANGCILEYPEIYVAEPAPILVDLGDDLTINLDETAQFDPEILHTTGAIDYFWTPTDSLNCLYDSTLNCPNPIVNTLFEQTYKLRIIDELGCQGEDFITVYVDKELEVYVPTGFTPNNDGINDNLMTHGKEGVKINYFRVFDRWGEKIFEYRKFDVGNEQASWDGRFNGTMMSSGVYVWTIEAELRDGSIKLFKGQTNLLR